MTLDVSTPKEHGRQSIRRQALLRLGAVMLIVVLGIALIGANSFYTRQQREIAQKHDVTRTFYQQLLPRIESQWLVHAEQTRARIEFTRILEESPTVRSAKLNTFLTAQSEFIEFSNLMVFGPDGRPLYRYGSDVARLPDSLKMLSTGWHFSNDGNELYRVFKVPLWLGSAGEGSLILFKTMNSGVLQAMVTPESHLYLFAAGVPVTRSDPLGPMDAAPGTEGLRSDSRPPVIQIDLRWPHASPLAPTLVVHHEFRDSISIAEFMLRPIGAILLVSVMLWLGLGRWLRGTVKRIESLETGARIYADGGAVDATSVALAPAHATRDEINDVADTVEYLIQRMHDRDLEQRTYLDTLAMLEEAVLELDCEGCVVHASPGWHRLTRRSENLKGCSITEFIHLDDVDAMRGICTTFKRGDKQQAQLRLRLRNDVGTEQWAECRLIAQMNNQGVLSGIRGVLRDITQTYVHEQQITHMALHDALTDLPNRVLLEDRIKIATRMASRSDHKVAVCFIDLDHFKKINDSLGHKAGDRLLVAFSNTLRSQLRAGDTLARWGGDEFVMLLPELADQNDAREVARKIQEALKLPTKIDDTEYVVTFSMGIAIYPDDAREVEELLSNADHSMFYAKTQGRNQACLYGDISDKGGGKRELYIQNKLVEAVAAKRIQAWFQPIVAAVDGDCQVVEVLARWHDEEFGWIGPATFIPIAESTGAIRELGYQIWSQSIAALVAWRLQGFSVRIAINVSKRQLFSNQFVEQLTSDLTANGLSPSDVIIEVTESVALLDVANASDRLDELHRNGFHIAIDDFGTGYSALSQLHEMPVNELKIDISFVRRIHEKAGYSMVQAIIQLAKALGLKTIAEGVEDEATATLLQTLGADYLQGYHFAKPMPRAEFEAWLPGKQR